jgi:hypothetical protein
MALKDSAAVEAESMGDKGFREWKHFRKCVLKDELTAYRPSGIYHL